MMRVARVRVENVVNVACMGRSGGKIKVRREKNMWRGEGQE
jgi:hypothetical protein